MGMQQDTENVRREYSRVDACIPCEYRIVPSEERFNLQARISGDHHTGEYDQIPSGGNSDPLLEEWLKIINSKLDTIMRLMTLNQEGYFGLPHRDVNISGGGISFCVLDAIPLGEILEIKTVLTFQQPVTLVIYGEVVKSVLINGSHSIALHYVHMDDSIRDLIVRFVFEREREIIRETRG